MHNFPILRAAAYQSLAWLAVTITALIALGRVGGYSAALGGLISLLPGIYFMIRYFQRSGARAMEQVVKTAYLAEAVKLVQMAAGFALVFGLVEPLVPMAVAGGFLAVQVAGLVISARLSTARAR